MKFKAITFLVALFLIQPCIGQIKISEVFQNSQIANQEDNQLYFIDFWATWCVPCIHVSKYLESLQKQYSDNFYVISLSKENPEVIEKFLLKHSTKLAVAVDFMGITFSENKVLSLPYGVLLNAQGKKVWEGHPADLKPSYVQNFLRTNKGKASFNEVFKVDNYKEPIEEEHLYEPRQDFEYVVLSDLDGTSVRSTEKKDFVEIEGRLDAVLAHILKANINQVVIPDNFNKYYKMYFKKESRAYSDMYKAIVKKLNLKTLDEDVEGDIYTLDIKKPTFWDVHQIDWGDNSERFLIGDTDFTADNVSVKDMAYTLANVLEKPVVIKNGFKDDRLYDWQIHYKYYDLMALGLYETYGIKIEKEKGTYTKHIITKKAP